MAVVVLQPGTYASLQDAGRKGYRHLAIPQSGALDIAALHYGNSLLNNALDRTTIECLGSGCLLQALKPLELCVTGASTELIINNEPREINSVYYLEAGSIIDARKITNGFASYICVKYGFQGKEVMGSESTLLSLSKSGYNGRLLKKRDVIEIKVPGLQPTSYQNKPVYNNDKIRCFKGPEWHLLSEESKNGFECTVYTISSQSSRMGFRLDGETLKLETTLQIESSPILPGTIQLPPNGQPIVVMNDGHTTGGYPRIGQIYREDMGNFVQRGTKGKVSFEMISL